MLRFGVWVLVEVFFLGCGCGFFCGLLFCVFVRFLFCFFDLFVVLVCSFVGLNLL